MLKAKANYETGQATIGIKSGDEISQQEVLDALKKIGYSGTFKEAVR